VVFNIKANDYRLVAVVQYEAGVLMIRFFGSHEDYDKMTRRLFDEDSESAGGETDGVSQV